MIQPLPVVTVRDLRADVHGRPRKTRTRLKTSTRCSTPFELLWPKFSTRDARGQGESRSNCRLFGRLGLDSHKSHRVWQRSHIFPGFRAVFLPNSAQPGRACGQARKLIPRSLILPRSPSPATSGRVRTTPCLSNGQATSSRGFLTAPGRRTSSPRRFEGAERREALYQVHALQRACEAGCGEACPHLAMRPPPGAPPRHLQASRTMGVTPSAPGRVS